MKILLIEDNIKIASNLKEGLNLLGFSVEVIDDGMKGCNYLRQHIDTFDLVLLDLLLPSMNGIDVCKQWRKENITTPVIMLTALSEIDNKIEGLDAGADDYITKPFHIKEISARITALMRRPKNFVHDIFVFGPIQLDNTKRTVSVNNINIYLTLQEFKIFNFLVRHSNQVVTREQILSAVWDYAFNGFSNVVDVHITNIRTKLGVYSNMIRTVRGIGYEITI